MAPAAGVAGLRLLRPMLGLDREAPRDFLRAAGIAWREDASNRSPRFRRNRVRREILPLIERRLNPSAVEALARTADLLREEDAWMDEAARRRLAGCRTGTGGRRLDADRLRRVPIPLRRRAWRLWLQAAGVPAGRIDAAAVARADALLERRDGSAWMPLGGGLRLERRYAEIRLARMPAPGARRAPARVPLAAPGVTELPAFGCRARADWARGFPTAADAGAGCRLPAACALDRRRAAAATLFFRARKPGDRIAPLGLRGRRKLQDILVDARLPRAERDRLPILVCGREIVWVPGYRIARAWAVAGPDAPALRIRIERNGG